MKRLRKIRPQALPAAKSSKKSRSSHQPVGHSQYQIEHLLALENPTEITAEGHATIPTADFEPDIWTLIWTEFSPEELLTLLYEVLCATPADETQKINVINLLSAHINERFHAMIIEELRANFNEAARDIYKAATLLLNLLQFISQAKHEELSNILELVEAINEWVTEKQLQQWFAMERLAEIIKEYQTSSATDIHELKSNIANIIFSLIQNCLQQNSKARNEILASRHISTETNSSEPASPKIAFLEASSAVNDRLICHLWEYDHNNHPAANAVISIAAEENAAPAVKIQAPTEDLESLENLISTFNVMLALWDPQHAPAYLFNKDINFLKTAGCLLFQKISISITVARLNSYIKIAEREKNKNLLLNKLLEIVYVQNLLQAQIMKCLYPTNPWLVTNNPTFLGEKIIKDKRIKSREEIYIEEASPALIRDQTLLIEILKSTVFTNEQQIAAFIAAIASKLHAVTTFEVFQQLFIIPKIDILSDSELKIFPFGWCIGIAIANIHSDLFFNSKNDKDLSCWEWLIIQLIEALPFTVNKLVTKLFNELPHGKKLLASILVNILDAYSNSPAYTRADSKVPLNFFSLLTRSEFSEIEPTQHLYQNFSNNIYLIMQVHDEPATSRMLFQWVYEVLVSKHKWQAERFITPDGYPLIFAFFDMIPKNHLEIMQKDPQNNTILHYFAKVFLYPKRINAFFREQRKNKKSTDFLSIMLGNAQKQFAQNAAAFQSFLNTTNTQGVTAYELIAHNFYNELHTYMKHAYLKLGSNSAEYRQNFLRKYFVTIYFLQIYYNRLVKNPALEAKFSDLLLTKLGLTLKEFTNLSLNDPRNKAFATFAQSKFDKLIPALLPPDYKGKWIKKFRARDEKYRTYTSTAIQRSRELLTDETPITAAPAQPADKSEVAAVDTPEANQKTKRKTPIPEGKLAKRKFWHRNSFFNKPAPADISQERGPSTIPGWQIQNVLGDGNCFYHAVIEQFRLIAHPFLQEVPPGTEPHALLRLRVQGQAYKDGEWSSDEDLAQFISRFGVTIAVVDTRFLEAPSYTYKFLVQEADGSSTIQEVFDPSAITNRNPIIRLAYTGDHFLSVVSDTITANATGDLSKTVEDSVKLRL
jgi:predicted house-cleaning noncanonical NTP pyrophosphatase (MazG superfamily)